jgi:ABC-2 type transport system permease protein
MNPLSTMVSIPAHAGRISVIAFHAFTQLVRMKVFYFLAFFALILIASNFFNLPQHEGPESAGINILRSIKSWSLGAMTLFSVVLSIVSTALLLPKDIEDRTLYTILAKPVPRLDYLAGKLLGVLLLVFVSLALMDLLMTGILHLRTNMVLADQVAAAEARNWPAADIALLKNDILAQGPTASLQGAVFSVFLRATIIASISLLISTFSSSTLFTTIIAFLVYFIGHFQADARAAYFSQEAGMSDSVLAKLGALLFSLVLPDFQLFNVIDAVIEGQVMPLFILGKLTLIGLFYAVFYIAASWLIFAKKEF